MIAEVVALVIFVAAAFAPDGSARYGAFDSKESCEAAVSAARAQGVFATDCVKVTLPQPKRNADS